MINHHAVLYITSTIDVIPIEVQNIETAYESFRFFVPAISIKDVRNLIERAYQKPFASAYQYILINTDTIPTEAQNALLKILEEPPATTRFVIIVRPYTTLLPTLRSRFAVGEASAEVVVGDFFQSFIQLTVTERLALIGVLAKDKDEVRFRELYQGLLGRLVTTSSVDEKKFLEPIVSYLQLRGASKKMIWEDIALRIPGGR